MSTYFVRHCTRIDHTLILARRLLSILLENFLLLIKIKFPYVSKNNLFREENSRIFFSLKTLLSCRTRSFIVGPGHVLLLHHNIIIIIIFPLIIGYLITSNSLIFSPQTLKFFLARILRSFVLHLIRMVIVTKMWSSWSLTPAYLLVAWLNIYYCKLQANPKQKKLSRNYRCSNVNQQRC